VAASGTSEKAPLASRSATDEANGRRRVAVIGGVVR
jgi:hypothetical protein